MVEKRLNDDGKEAKPLIFTDKMLEADFDEVFRDYPLSEDTSCGIGFLRGKSMQM
jgi:hypothetical protein